MIRPMSGLSLCVWPMQQTAGPETEREAACAGGVNRRAHSHTAEDCTAMQCTAPFQSAASRPPDWRTAATEPAAAREEPEPSRSDRGPKTTKRSHTDGSRQWHSASLNHRSNRITGINMMTQLRLFKFDSNCLWIDGVTVDRSRQSVQIGPSFISIRIKLLGVETTQCTSRLVFCCIVTHLFGLYEY